MLGTIFCVVAVISFVGLFAHVCTSKDRRIDYIERERMKRDLEFYKWI